MIGKLTQLTTREHENLAAIRDATPADDVSLAELTRALLEYEHSLVEPICEVKPCAASREELRLQLQFSNTRFFVAEQVLGPNARRVVGYLKAVIIGKPESFDEAGALNRLGALAERIAHRVYAAVLHRPRSSAQIVTGYIAGVFVHPDARRLGIGRLLTARAEEWFREQGVKGCELHVLESNGAGRAFWEEIGYAPISVGMRKKL